MKRFLVSCYTNWCGENQEYVAIAESDSDEKLLLAAQAVAYENFENYLGTGFIGVIDDLFGTEDPEELNEEQLQEAYETESSYYGFTITEWDEESGDDWDWYDLIYDASEEI